MRDTNITEDHCGAFDALTSDRVDNFCLVSWERRKHDSVKVPPTSMPSWNLAGDLVVTLTFSATRWNRGCELWCDGGRYRLRLGG